MELKNTINFKSNIYEFILKKYPILKNATIVHNIIGYEAPTSFLVHIEASLIIDDERIKDNAIIFFECTFNKDCDNQSQSNLLFIIDFQLNSDFQNWDVFHENEEIFYGTLSSDKQFMGFCVKYKECNSLFYSCFIIDLLNPVHNSINSRSYVVNRCNKLCKFRFILPPMNSAIISTSPSKQKKKMNFFSKIQSTHILFSIENCLIKYQKFLLTPMSIFVQNENTLCSKLFWYEWKSEMARLYLLENLNNGTNIILKAFQLLWTIPVNKEKECEFQLLFSYELSLLILPDHQHPDSCDNGAYINNPRVLEHSNGSICFCYEQDREGNNRLYRIHLIHSENIIECRLPNFISQQQIKILFTVYKNYLLAISKCFIHIIDLNYQSKSISSFIWPSCLDTIDFQDLQILNTNKYSKIYLIQNSDRIISLSLNFIEIANMIKEDYQLSEKMGALNFIVYNCTRNEKENVLQLIVDNIVHSIKNSLSVSRLFEEFLVTSLNRYLRLRISEENIMKYIDSTTLPCQFSTRLFPKLNGKYMTTDDDIIKVNIRVVKQDALVLFVKEKLQNPQMKRFFNLINILKPNDYSDTVKTFSPVNQKVQDLINESKFSNSLNVPNYLTQSLLNAEQLEELNNLILTKFTSARESENTSFFDFVEKVKIGILETWKLLLLLIHKSTFHENLPLWNDVYHLKRSSNKKLFNFHQAIGAFKYTLYLQKMPVPSNINDLYILTSYNVLSNKRFFNYLKLSKFSNISNNYFEFFIQFYFIYKNESDGNKILEKIKDRILSKMSLNNKMKILPKLNIDDQNNIIKEYGDYINKQTGIFDQRYNEIIQKIYTSCDTPSNALYEFYKYSMNKDP